MANKTSIEWTDYNWNFLRGCSRVSEGCRNCYAESVAARFSGFDDKGKELPYFGLAEMVNGKPRWTGEIKFLEDVLLQPLRWTKPRKVFVNSMSDLFHEKVTDEMLDKAFAVMALTPQHTYQILTKRPERMKAYLSKHDVGLRWAVATDTFTISWDKADFRRMVGPGTAVEWTRNGLPNVWLGVSVEDQKTANERIPLLLQTPAAVRWVSAEPLLDAINLHRLAGDQFGWGRTDALNGLYYVRANALEYGCEWETKRLPRLDWVVVGGESGPRARETQLFDIRGIVDQCQTFNVPVFVKQLGAKVLGRDCEHGRKGEACSYVNKKGGDIDEWPEDLRIREFPRVLDVGSDADSMVRAVGKKPPTFMGRR
jgi:protein gp37